jgi:hypothetical protein
MRQVRQFVGCDHRIDNGRAVEGERPFDRRVQLIGLLIAKAGATAGFRQHREIGIGKHDGLVERRQSGLFRFERNQPSAELL